MQFESFVRCTGKWTASCYISSFNSEDFLELYTEHFIQMLKTLSKYQILKVLRYTVNLKEFLIPAYDRYDYDFWINIFSSKNNYTFIDIYGETMVYKENKPIWLSNIIQLTVDFDISESFLWTSIKLSNDDWLPYHFIENASINVDYEKNASRLEKMLIEFFCEKYNYDIGSDEETDVIGTVKGFRIDNSYATIDHELVIYDKRGRYIDSIDPKLIK